MKNLRFKQLLLLSDTQKSANLFKFQNRFNLIKANDNSVGKSTLAKLLFWVFGCEPDFDSTWKSQDCKVLLTFSVNENDFSIFRHGNIIQWQENKSEFIKFTQITGDYSSKFAQLVNFKVLLPDRSDESKLVIPPPAYYFLPFYIDQKRGWSKAWDSFNSLEQFENWKNTVIKYHIGYLSPKHFELEEDSFIKKQEIGQLNEDIRKIGYALEVVAEHTSHVEITIKEKEFEAMTAEIQHDLSHLSKEQEYLLNELSELISDKTYLEHQKSIAQQLMKELEEDYVFSVENFQTDEIECPLCGTIHENSIVSRTSILVDKQQAEEQLKSIVKKLISINTKIKSAEQKSNEIKSQINTINAKYLTNEDSGEISLNEIIESFAYKAIDRNITETKKVKLVQIDDFKSEQKEIKKEQSGLLSKNDKEEINANFMDLLTTYIKLLDADGVNLSSIKTPLDYNKIIKEGGAAENTRGVLAYYLAIFSLIDIHGYEVKAPLVIDTPNQQEQSDKNYENILKLIISKIPETEQIIICAMDNEKLKDFEKKANVIILDKNKLLDVQKYDEIKNIFNTLGL